MTNPTGAQFEISRGGARAVITEIGAGLRAFDIDGVPYLETFDESTAPPKAAGQVLLPWPNRTAAATWHWHGQPQRLEVTEPARGNAIHGLTRNQRWELIEHAESSITLATDVPAQQGWPVPLRATVDYEVAPRELTVTHHIRNEGESDIGVGLGAHPYLRIGDTSTDELELRVTADRVRPFDDQTQLPYAAEKAVTGSEYDLSDGVLLRDVDLDTAFRSLPVDGGRHEHVLAHARTKLVLWADLDFCWVQVFTPKDLVGRGRAVAIEPMTCPPDALNSGVDLISLKPAESWTGSWGIRLPLR